MKDRHKATCVEASIGGDSRAYEELVRLHAGRVYALCLAMVRNVPDAKDLAQEALVRGFIEISSLRDRERFGSWIAAIAGNLCRDFLRRRSMVERAPADPPALTEVDADRAIDLRRKLERLPERHLVPLLLYYYDGRSVDHVAETLGISREAVYMRLSRARRELRRLIDGEGKRP